MTGALLGLPGQFSYVVDVNLNYFRESVVLALDAELGLVELDFRDNITGRVVVAHRMCESFDSVERDHVVLLCQNQGHSTIIEAYREYNPRSHQHQYRKLEPIFQSNYLNDLHVADSYYLVYSYKNILVFWNTRKNQLPETLETQSSINLPALETFALTRNMGLTFLYTVEAGTLFKYRLEEQPASLSLKAPDPLSKAFKISMFGACADIQLTTAQSTGVEACKLTREVVLEVSAEEYTRREDFGISVSIVAILVLVFLLIIWICLKKYKGLEQEARRVLKNYQNKRIKATREI